MVTKEEKVLVLARQLGLEHAATVLEWAVRSVAAGEEIEALTARQAFEAAGLRDELRALARKAGYLPPRVKELGLFLQRHEENLAAGLQPLPALPTEGTSK